MEEKNKNFNNFLILAMILVIIMGVCIYQRQKDKNDVKEEIAKSNNQISLVEESMNKFKENSNYEDSNNSNITTNNVNSTNVNKATSEESEPNVTTNDQAKTKSNDEDIVGKWNTYSAINSEGENVNLANIFGSSYIQYGSYLQLKEDGTFLDAIYPVTDGSNSVKGTYKILKDYNKLGDCYVELNYEDGNTKMLQRVYYEDNIETLTTGFTKDQGYQFDLRK